MSLMLAARNSSIANRFARGPSAMARSGGSSLAQPSAKSENRQIATTRPASLVPSRAPKSDSAGAVIGRAAPVALTLAGARVLDRSKMGQAVEEFTGGATASDVLGAAAILARLSGVDAAVPSARAQISRTIEAKVVDWGGRLGDGLADAIGDWEKSREAKAAAAKKDEPVPAAKAKAERVAAEVNAQP